MLLQTIKSKFMEMLPAIITIGVMTLFVWMVGGKSEAANYLMIGMTAAYLLGYLSRKISER
jgi:hypothetical protein